MEGAAKRGLTWMEMQPGQSRSSDDQMKIDIFLFTVAVLGGFTYGGLLSIANVHFLDDYITVYIYIYMYTYIYIYIHI